MKWNSESIYLLCHPNQGRRAKNKTNKRCRPFDFLWSLVMHQVLLQFNNTQTQTNSVLKRFFLLLLLCKKMHFYHIFKYFCQRWIAFPHSLVTIRQVYNISLLLIIVISFFAIITLCKLLLLFFFKIFARCLFRVSSTLDILRLK